MVFLCFYWSLCCQLLRPLLPLNTHFMLCIHSVETLTLSIAVPSQAPKSLTVTAGSSTTVTASWQLPPLDSRNGIITGFKLFYKKKTASGSLAMLRIDNGAIHDKTVIGLDKNTEYEFQVLAFTSTGDGPKSSPVVVRTRKDGKNLNDGCECYALSLFLTKDGDLIIE